jgi:predicted TIM-barrel fold metal-dependent hydrolase
VRYANTMLKKKMPFGSDWPMISPMISPEKWLDAFDKAGFKDEVRPGILKDNAAKLLGLP